MPTANSAVFVQPIDDSQKKSRTRRIAFGALLGLTLLVPAATVAAPSAAAAASNGCAVYASESRMPRSIRVLKVQTNKIVTVDFRKYVVTVMGKEWPSYLPQAVVEAGSVAVKQYGWYYSMRPRKDSRGRCFDVRDSTGDQLYKPDKARIRSDHHRALDRTWGVHLIKNGRLFMTGYRRGNKGRCGSDATGWKLYARTATRCANAGKGYLEILRIYYSPGLNIQGGGSSSASTASSSQADSSVQAFSSAQAVSSAQTVPFLTTDTWATDSDDTYSGVGG